MTAKSLPRTPTVRIEAVPPLLSKLKRLRLRNQNERHLRREKPWIIRSRVNSLTKYWWRIRQGRSFMQLRISQAFASTILMMRLKGRSLWKMSDLPRMKPTVRCNWCLKVLNSITSPLRSSSEMPRITLYICTDSHKIRLQRGLTSSTTAIRILNLCAWAARASFSTPLRTNSLTSRQSRARHTPGIESSRWSCFQAKKCLLAIIIQEIY